MRTMLAVLEVGVPIDDGDKLVLIEQVMEMARPLLAPGAAPSSLGGIPLPANPRRPGR